MKAPEFPAGLDWINTPRPLKLADLRGKIVLLDFWTYCCINCMQIIPDLKRLESEFAKELVVIGVHSAKFTQEGETENIRSAVRRYEIEHPVVNDRNFVIWQSYGVHAWPTVVLIDPLGRIVQHTAGEGVYSSFVGSIRQLISDYDPQGLIDRSAVEFPQERGMVRDEYLAFPGKVLADSEGERLFIADQNNNRIVICRMDDGTVIETIGNSNYGFKDGGFDVAEFKHPQGMALRGDMLYVADTENSAIREVDLTGRQVTTLARTGRRHSWGNPGESIDIEPGSPWDIIIDEDMLYVAMAGTHQIYTVRLKDGFVQLFAGSGREGLTDGVRNRASLAQPSGLVKLGERIYFVDSEVSAVRFVELIPDGRVGTVVGLDLFEFGDRDGVGDDVRLQHPLGITTDGKMLYIADTYNNKIKVVNPVDRSVKTLFGDGKPGMVDGDGRQARFYEPGGLSYSKGKIYIADTNNSRIRVADLETGIISTLSVSISFSSQPNVSEQRLPVQFMKPGRGEIAVKLTPGKGMKLNTDFPVGIALIDGGGVVVTQSKLTVLSSDDVDRFALPAEWSKGAGEIVLEVIYGYCAESDANLCYPGVKRLRIPIEVVSDGKDRLVIDISG